MGSDTEVTAATADSVSLHEAVRSGNLETALHACEAYRNLNLLIDGKFALELAIELGHIAVAVLLLNTDTLSTEHKQAALPAAIQSGNLEVIYALIKAGVDINAAVRQAAKDGALDLISSLLNAGANADDAIRAAAAAGQLHAVEFLLENNANPNTALATAAQHGQLATVQALLAKYPNLDISTALNKACLGGQLNVAQWLVEQMQADVNAAIKSSQDELSPINQAGLLGAILYSHNYSWDLPPLAIAAAAGHADVVAYLLQQGADVHAERELALRLACRYGQLAAVKLLVDAGADVKRDGDHGLGVNAFIEAVTQNRTDVVKFFLRSDEKDELVNPPGTAGSSIYVPLYNAAGHGHLKMVQLLVEHKAKVNHPYGQYSPLSSAASAGHLNVVKFLVRHGATTNLGSGLFSPLEMAAQGGHPQVLCYLIEAVHQGTLATEISTGSPDDDPESKLSPATEQERRIKVLLKDFLSILSVAAQHGHLAAVAAALTLLEQYDNDPGSENRRIAIESALTHCIHEGPHIFVVEYLLCHLAEIKPQNVQIRYERIFYPENIEEALLNLSSQLLMISWGCTNYPISGNAMYTTHNSTIVTSGHGDKIKRERWNIGVSWRRNPNSKPNPAVAAMIERARVYRANPTADTMPAYDRLQIIALEEVEFYLQRQAKQLSATELTQLLNKLSAKGVATILDEIKDIITQRIRDFYTDVEGLKDSHLRRLVKQAGYMEVPAALLQKYTPQHTSHYSSGSSALLAAPAAGKPAENQADVVSAPTPLG